QLRKDKPHPVPLLAPPPQFGANLGKYRVLRVDKAPEIVRVAGVGRHRHRAFPRSAAAAYADENQDMNRAMPETDLYPAVKRFLERAGFACKGEICGCDIAAVRDGAPVRLAIVEMKLSFNLALLLQAVDRSRAADEVWLAVPATRRGR